MLNFSITVIFLEYPLSRYSKHSYFGEKQLSKNKQNKKNKQKKQVPVSSK